MGSISGIFTLRKRLVLLAPPSSSVLTPSLCSELRFFYQDGASHLFPEAW